MQLKSFSWLFAASFPILLFTLLHIFISLFDVKYLLKPVVSILIILSALVAYAEFQYSILFDYGMIENIFQTSQAEAQMYVNSESVIWIIIVGLIPGLLSLYIRVEFGRPFQHITKKVAYLAISITLLSGTLLFFYKDYASFGRNNKEMVHMITPLNVVTNTIKYINRTYLYTPPNYMEIALDAKLNSVANDKPNLLVLLVGETSRSKNHKLYGYEKNTNPYTSDKDLVVFNDVSSCGTATAVSVPCMFSLLTKDEFTRTSAKYQDNVLDILKRASINVEWLDNDGTCKDVCTKIEHVFFNPSEYMDLCDGQYCYDQILINHLEATISKYEGRKKDTVIVLHLVGSHGPTYFKRYPGNFKVFKPDCPRSDIQNCTQEELVNTYDNTILYSDYIYSSAIELVQEHRDWSSSVMYISDHGESLGEGGLYLHGIPYAIAPEEQIKVPMYLWMSEDYENTHNIDKPCLISYARAETFSHDNLFHTILGLMDIRTNIYEPDLDVLSPCKKTSKVASNS